MTGARRCVALLGLLVTVAAWAGDAAPRPGPRDKCPVCGMFVSRYPDWTASAVLRDGTVAWFDGAKDLFRFLARPEAYGRPGAVAERITVTDYYAVQPVDARQAYFVLGGDVLGPMGKELVPFGRRSDAEEFLRDHKGTAILRFDEIRPAVLEALD